MGIEIERKFLVDAKQWNKLSKPAGIDMRQGYIVNHVDKAVRVRVTGEQAYITFKNAGNGFTRNEYEYEIPVNDGVELLEKFTKAPIHKTRYCIMFDNKVWEVDVFADANEGLIVAEIELDQEDEQFELPPWITTEVTKEEKYYNSALSIKPFKTW